MPRRGSKQPYKAKKEYTYTIKDIADLAGITRNALNVAKAHGKIDPADFGSVVTFLTRRIIQQRLSGDLFAPDGRASSKPGKRSRKAAGSSSGRKTVRRK